MACLVACHFFLMTDGVMLKLAWNVELNTPISMAL